MRKTSSLSEDVWEESATSAYTTTTTQERQQQDEHSKRKKRKKQYFRLRRWIWWKHQGSQDVPQCIPSFRKRGETVSSTEDDIFFLAIDDKKHQIWRNWVTAYAHNKSITIMKDTGSPISILSEKQKGELFNEKEDKWDCTARKTRTSKITPATSKS